MAIFAVAPGSRSPGKAPYSNPYAVGDQGWPGMREDALYSSTRLAGSDNAPGRTPRGGWQEDSWGGRESIPMDLIPPRPPSPAWQHDTSELNFLKSYFLPAEIHSWLIFWGHFSILLGCLIKWIIGTNRKSAHF